MSSRDRVPNQKSSAEESQSGVGVPGLLGAFENHGEDEAHENVLDAARTAILEFGMRRTSMAEIARRSGVSPATLYRWYKSKDEVVAAVLMRETKRFIANLEANVDREAPPHERLTELAVQTTRRLREQPLLRRLSVTDPETVLPRLTTEAGPWLEIVSAYVAKLLRNMMAEGGIEAFDPGPIAEVLTRLIHSLLLTPSPRFSTDDEDALRAVVRDLARWFFPPPTR